MSHRIDIGGRQGRGNPRFGLGEDGTLIDLDITKPADRTQSVWGDLATGVGLLAENDYSEPETSDLQLGPMTQGEHLVKWLLVSLVVCGSIAGAVILATN
jgi:hypothetical protein